MPTYREIRAELERRLGRTIGEGTWHWLGEHGYLEDVEADPAEAYAAMAREVRLVEGVARDLDRAPAPAPSARSIPIRTTPDGHDPKLDALAVLYAEHATLRDPRVARFREEVPGSPVDAGRARTLLDSLIAANLAGAVIRHFKIPMLDHRTTLVAQDTASHDATVDVTWAGGRETVHVWAKAWRWEQLEYAVDDGPPLMVDVDRGSLLDDLRRAANDLAAAYLWPVAEAARFLLEGTRPSIVAGEIDLRQVLSAGPPRSTITIRAEAWLPAETIASAFRDIQERVLPGGPKRLHPRLARAVAFVSEYRQSNARFTWAAALAAWNAAQTDPAMRWPEFRTFRRDCIRGEEALMRIPYRITPMRDDAAT